MNTPAADFSMYLSRYLISTRKEKERDFPVSLDKYFPLRALSLPPPFPSFRTFDSCLLRTLLTLKNVCVTTQSADRLFSLRSQVEASTPSPLRKTLEWATIIVASGKNCKWNTTGTPETAIPSHAEARL